jgi:hypothetical protein
MAVTGLNEVITNLNREIKKIEGLTHEGLLAAGAFIKGESQETTPVEFGVLNNSAFMQSFAPLSVTIGYTAKYAQYVHEMPSTYNYTKPGTGSKFLEKAVKNNGAQILRIIEKRAKV